MILSVVGDAVIFPEGSLASGDIRVEFGDGRVDRINGALVKWVSTCTRTLTRKKKKPQAA